MALSRLAKKFRDQEPTQTTTAPAARKPAKPQVKTPPAPAAAPPAAPVAAESTAAPAPEVPGKPGKRSRDIPKRERFVYVPTKTERKAPASPGPLAPRSNKLSAKLMTKNLALPPEDENVGGLLGVAGRGRL